MKRFSQRLIGLFFVFLIVFSFPVINVFWKSTRIWGIPLVYLYVFGMWMFVVILLYILIEYKK